MEVIIFERDPRTTGMFYGTDHNGTPRIVNQLLLRDIMSAWPKTTTTPPEPARILAAARSMVITSLVAYEQLAIAIMISLQAVEAALRARLAAAALSTSDKNGRDLNWAALVNRATSHGLLRRNPDQLGMDLWDYGRKLRNDFAHPKDQTVLTYAGALPIIETSHRLIADLFPPNSA